MLVLVVSEVCAPGDTVLEGLETDAREGWKGLWADPQPVPPWVYRKARRGQSRNLSDLIPLDAETEGMMASRGPPLLGAREPDSAVSSSPYPIIGNPQSHIYHRPDCPNYRGGLGWLDSMFLFLSGASRVLPMRR